MELREIVKDNTKIQYTTEEYVYPNLDKLTYLPKVQQMRRYREMGTLVQKGKQWREENPTKGIAKIANWEHYGTRNMKLQAVAKLVRVEQKK